jgi:asparagine synthase (glutamine-hydrolysing)
MCGIAGFIDRQAIGRSQRLAIASRMAYTMVHRGPDDEGVWAPESPSVAFSFRRLSIIDLSPAGHQPMHSACGRFTIIFNGEVYNHGELRGELESSGHRFRGTSDTEVILAAIAQWGVRAAVSRFVGMFAIALWDANDRKLYLVRDRLGIKPLYYGWNHSVFLFASELKAFHAHPDFKPELNRPSIALLQRFGYIPHPYSVYQGVQKLPPGHILELSARENDFGSQTLESYWDVYEIAAASRSRNSSLPAKTPIAETTEKLESLLAMAVKMRMISDVPLGAFLSGGIDSSLVVALMQQASSRPVQTFTIGFDEDAFNEAKYAKQIAAHLGTDHTELYVRSREAQDVVPQLPDMFDEPYSDSSQIPTHLVSKLARRTVTVCLSGDGGDELFGGYDRYQHGDRAWSRFGRLPAIAKRSVSYGLRRLAPDQWDQLYGLAAPLLPRNRRVSFFGRKVHKLSRLLAAEQPERFYCLLVSQWQDTSEVVRGITEPATLFDQFRNGGSATSFRQRMMLLDLVTYLPGDILTKVDRASMYVSLEARVPLLDHRVVEFALSLPESLKFRDGESKFILRRVLERHVPRSLFERPKMGFGVPIGQWLRGPLRDWAESLLSERSLLQDDIFNVGRVRGIWKEHLSERCDWGDRLWTVLSFQAWRARWRHDAGAHLSLPGVPTSNGEKCSLAK